MDKQLGRGTEEGLLRVITTLLESPFSLYLGTDLIFMILVLKQSNIFLKVILTVPLAKKNLRK